MASKARSARPVGEGVRCLVWVARGEGEHPAGDALGFVGHVRGAVALEYGVGFVDLDGGADRAAQGPIPERDVRGGLDAASVSDSGHGPCEADCPVVVGDEPCGSGAHVEEEAAGSFGHLLGHDRTRDELDRVHAVHGLADAVEDLVAGRGVGAGLGDEAAVRLELLE
jgi:hypothetical protein